MTFTVKYRAKNGSVTDETIEAVDRSDCIAKFRARGIVPISVMKGCGRGKNEKTNFIPKTPNRKTIFAVALLIAVEAVLLLNITGSASYRNTESARNRKTKEHIQATARAKTECVEKSDTATNSLIVTTAIQKTAAVSEEKRTDDEALRKKWKEKFARHRSIFSNASDQILSMIANSPPGREMPPMPITRGIDRDFIKSLESPIEISENDSDEIKANFA